MGVRERRVFAVGAQAYTWADVIAAGRAWGDWGEIERRARDGLARQRLAAERGYPFSEDDVDAAGREFRYERRLLAAEELYAWLEHWELTVAAWLDHLRRALLRAAPAEPQARDEPPPEVVWAEAVCSGALERLARKVAERAAAYRATTGTDPGGDHAGMQAAFEELTARAVSARAIEEQIAAHRLDWVEADVRRVTFPAEETAREAALCVRIDGLALAAVAEQAGLAMATQCVALEAAEPELQPHLLSAEPGDLIGPLALDGAFCLVEVADKRPPSAGDPDIVARAERLLRERAATDAVLSEVTWHEHLRD